MTKTLEEMAEEYAACWTSQQLCELKDAIGMLVNKWQQEGFLAGYKAAMNRQESYERELGIIKARLDTAAQLYSLANEEKEQ